MSFALSVEGYEETNDDRRGKGVFEKVMHAMDLMKEYGLLYGVSICYTSKNYQVVTSDEFPDAGRQRRDPGMVLPLYAGRKRRFCRSAAYTGAESIHGRKSTFRKKQKLPNQIVLLWTSRTMRNL